MLECKICGYKHQTMISSSHLKRHGITGQEYKTKYPGSILRIQTEESKNKMSLSRKGCEVWNKGIPQSTEQRKKQSVTKKAKFASGEIIHWNTGNKTSKETKARISASCTGLFLTPEQKEKQQLGIKLWTDGPNYSPRFNRPRTELEKQKIGKGVLNAYSNIRKSQETLGNWIPLKDIPEVKKYKREVWRLTNQNVHLIENYDSSKRGRCSLTEDNWQVDHKLSITQGWLDGLSPEQMSHPANLQFIPWRDNLSKWHRSSLEKDELISLINK